MQRRCSETIQFTIAISGIHHTDRIQMAPNGALIEQPSLHGHSESTRVSPVEIGLSRLLQHFFYFACVSILIVTSFQKILKTHTASRQPSHQCEVASFPPCWIEGTGVVPFSPVRVIRRPFWGDESGAQLMSWVISRVGRYEPMSVGINDGGKFVEQRRPEELVD